MLGSQAVLFDAVFAGDDTEFARFLGGWLAPDPAQDDDWVLVTPPAALDPRHTHPA